MSNLSEVPCPTPRCVTSIAKYGTGYHRVYDVTDRAESKLDGSTLKCELCGGKFIDGVWVHKCKTCKVDVAPGELRGLFVPHKCVACEEKTAADEVKRGAVCGICKAAYSRCCC